MHLFADIFGLLIAKQRKKHTARKAREINARGDLKESSQTSMKWEREVCFTHIVTIRRSVCLLISLCYLSLAHLTCQHKLVQCGVSVFTTLIKATCS